MGTLQQFVVKVSIHAPVWGATVVVRLFHERAAVSIHAPVWGATATQAAIRAGYSVSIHAPVWGATKNRLQVNASGLFQSTHPCGVRLSDMIIIGFAVRFNPRTRVGCDAWQSVCANVNRFQSTHPCGVRLIQATRPTTRKVSIHAPVWGATEYAVFSL